MSRIQFVPDVRADDDSDDSGDEGTRVGQEGPGDDGAPGFAKPQAPKKKPSDNFQASTTFQGPKPGFTFKVDYNLKL